MHDHRHDDPVALIYEAAMDGSRWPDAVGAISRSLGCAQGTFELHDPGHGVADIVAPLCDPSFQQSHAQYYGKLFSLGGHTGRLPVGQLHASTDFGIDEAFRKGEFYNEWWLPQGTGGASLLSNIAREGRATASLTIYKPFGVDAFTAAERARFAGVVDHMIRAVAIHRRLRIAALAVPAAAGPRRPDAFVVVDRDGRVLMSDPDSSRRLRAAGLLANGGAYEHVRSDTGAIERLVARTAADRPTARSGGDLTVVGPDGRRLTVSAIPCGPGDRGDGPAVDRPAALLFLSDPGERRAGLVRRLVERHGLTPAEAAVAIEIGRGDGRRAAGARLGITESTVRAHLNAIFGKLDMRRQAELVGFLERV